MATASGTSVLSDLEALFGAAITAAFPGAADAGAGAALVAQCNNASNGDYQCNNAMPLFGKMKGRDGAPKNPRAAAEAILAALPANGMVSGTSLAGPGFINVRVSPDYLSDRINNMLDKGMGVWAPALPGPYRRVIVDFSSPNVAKEMHVGHLRSTILGDTICRVLDFCGAEVVRLNHIGDWGTQFGMLIQHMAELRPGGLDEAGDEDVSDLMALYRASKARFDAEEDFKTRAREAVTRLQSGDEASLAAWRRICAASRREFNALYARLGVGLEERGESFYNPMLKGVVEELKEAGVAVESEGATCVFVEGKEVPLIVQKSDGGYGYASTDMAAIKHRVKEEHADWVIYVTDVGQSEHFQLVFAAARRAGWLPADDKSLAPPRVTHVGFGLVLGEDGKKFKTRSGDVVRLVELLDEAKARCRDTIRTRREESGDPISEEELEAAACAMGYGAVKYADLKNSRLTNYRFSFDAMLDLKGNTAVYLQYAHARIASIVRKSGGDPAALLAGGSKVVLDHPKEVALGMALCQFPEAISGMLDEIMPNRITDYLYSLSEAFNQFYTECKVVGSEQEASRMLLSEATARVMRQCFSLLGITPLYKI
ncbi:MAG: tRNA synthetases class I (R)-domain-containing protein [Monoraphidium minutum]|nr:MAG: tRNA synthetases class I (R)-domain-containing protein [Monoraphidium minutum]